MFVDKMFTGAMYFPNPWWSTSECTENMSPEDCEFISGIPNDCKGSSTAGMEKMAKVPTALNPQDYGIGLQTTPKWLKEQLKKSLWV